ncbi:beta-aspartyl-peptidase (threonine type) [bacterium A37T11]|nr:beta-aspartyl-peptidase (threonine type) [bacterium A37T11]
MLFKNNFCYTLWLLLMLMAACSPVVKKEKYVLVIHGGAGTIVKGNMTPEKEVAYRAALSEALDAGYKVIQKGESSLNAVEAAIHVLENSPLFNAGKGAVFTHEGKNELDASIMDGYHGTAGAVAGVTTIKNPITAARAVMEKSVHVMLTGTGAEKFAKAKGLEMVDPSYFYTKERWDALQEALKEDSLALLKGQDQKTTAITFKFHDNKFGTVGCVALDKQGHLAAGTSTGGMTDKRFGRVGDSPIIGAGTFADRQVGISCTGWGEFFIRHVVAHDVAALIEYKRLDITHATREVLDKVGKSGGDGGLIALDKDGDIAMPFNTEGMYRGSVTSDGKIQVDIYK